MFSNKLYFAEMPGLVAYFPLDSVHGRNDISPYQASNVTASAVNLGSGPANDPRGSYYFRGDISSYLSFPTSLIDQLDTRFSITVMAWAYGQTDGPLFAYSANGVNVFYKSAPAIYCGIKSRLSSAIRVLEQPLEGNRWRHFTCSYDYSSGVQTLWVDGKPMMSKNVGSFEIQTTNEARTGARRQGDRKYFKGNVADLRVYNRALHQEEILAAIKWRTLRNGKGKDKISF